VKGETEQDSRYPNILAVHQGYELYGSDRTFISSLHGLRNYYPRSVIHVVLPQEGELAELLRAADFTVQIDKLWVARKSHGVLRLASQMLLFPIFVWRALQRMRVADVCYINTAVIFDYAIAARFAKAEHVIHVHEIPTGLALRVVTGILKFSRAMLIYNSSATERAFKRLGMQRHQVILNGVNVQNVPNEQDNAEDKRALNILMIGRINDWKGQDLLLEAVTTLNEAEAAQLAIRFVGSTFESSPAEAKLRKLAGDMSLPCRISFDGFVKDPSPLYKWADAVVVPSRKPEPFGLVAVEAMAHSLPVVAANHGGLAEIVVNGQTGILFEPNNGVELGRAIKQLAGNPGHAKAMGSAGRRRYEELFTEASYQRNIADAVGRLVDKRNACASAGT
jgi:glycosyltransferase involved in cell wall biosynthesis